MNYIAFVYSILLLFSTYFAYKKKMSSSKISLIISLFLFFLTLLNLFFFNFLLKALISILLILISVSFFYDRKMSKKQIHYSHHCVRLIFHLLIIYFLYHQHEIDLLLTKRAKRLHKSFRSIISRLLWDTSPISEIFMILKPLPYPCQCLAGSKAVPTSSLSANSMMPRF